jgi:hypothetical protein
MDGRSSATSGEALVRKRYGVHAERLQIREEAEEPYGQELRALVVAMKRVTTVERRGAGR